MSLREEVEQHYEVLESIVEGKTEAILPVVIVHGAEKGGIFALEGLPDEHDDKCTMFRQLGKNNPVENILSITFASEAWMVTLDKDEGIPDGRVSQHPRKVEAVVVVGMTSQGETYQRIAPIERDEDNIISLGESKDTADTVESPLLSSFFEGVALR